MTSDTAPTAAQIAEAVDLLKNRWPSYGELLDFYGQIFMAQENAKTDVSIVPIELSEEMLVVKAAEKFPLITISEFDVDMDSAQNLFRKIGAIAQATQVDMATPAQEILKTLDSHRLDLDMLFTQFLREGDTGFAKTVFISEEVHPETLAFMIYNSLAPSLAVCAQQMAAFLKDRTDWYKGYCPICGSAPALSILKKEGERALSCSFCRFEWPVRRMYCPYCENRDVQKLQYFFSEEEEEYRVDLCDQCRRYIKTVDARKISRSVYAPLELVATLHFDVKAADAGYECGISLGLNV
jgi:FdhE protein